MVGEWATARHGRSSVARTFGKALVAAGALAAGAVSASAGSIIGPVFRIDVTSDGKTGSYELPFDPALYNNVLGTYDMTSTETIAIRDANGEVLATVGQISMHYVVDPVISLGFLVQSGNAATSFTITSALLAFAPINPAQASASAQVGATDLDGNGVSVVGAYAGNSRSYIANYNGFVPAGTNYATLVPNQAAGVFGSTVTTDGQPPGGGFLNIGGPVTSMSTQFSFTLSANDQASGTSVFVVTPEPSSIAALVLGAFVTIIRRR